MTHNSQKYLIVDTQRCKSCQLCIPVCPNHCLTISGARNSAGFLAISCDAQKCIGCGNCTLTCPEPQCLTLADSKPPTNHPIPNQDKTPNESRKLAPCKEKCAVPASDSTNAATKRSFLKGNDAIICGALYAGCRAFFGYPITPASEIAHDAMKAFPQAGALAIQAESEIAAINMLYGAAATGTPAMTATSGPGFSLMQEGISYMAAARLPGVIVDIMRAGPGLGNIAPEQGDYNVATHGGGHGHYHTPVIAPASVQEMFDFVNIAFSLAFQYLTPVIILADAFIGQMMETIKIPEILQNPAQIASHRFPVPNSVQGNPQTQGNIVSSLQLVPQKLHLDNDIRFQTYREIESNIPTRLQPQIDVQDEAECPQSTVIIGYGICGRIANEATKIARLQKHQPVAFFRPRMLWPFPEKALIQICKNAQKLLVVECNRGQMIDDVERIVGRQYPEIRIDAVQTDGGLIPAVDDILKKI